MTKLFLIVVAFVVTTLSANEVHWAKDFQSGVATAQKEHKPILFIFSSTQCKYCVLLEENALSDAKVINSLNKDYVAIISYVDKGDYVPRELWRPGTPTIWFLDPNGEPMYAIDRNFPLVGAIDKKIFVQILAIVKQDFDKKNKGK